MTKSGKGYKGVGMEGPIALWYATSTGKDPARFQEGVDKVTERLAPGGHVLEVAPGPGYLSIELARTGDYTVTGLDISETFVGIARKKAAEAGVEVDFRHGNASAMPFAGESFDFVICCAAFKNFSDPVGALREMHRVLRPGGRALIVDLRPDVSKEAVDADVARMRLGPVSRLFTKYVLAKVLPRRAYSVRQFEAIISHTDFGGHEIRLSPMGLDVELVRKA